jgi:hypothetical protein
MSQGTHTEHEDHGWDISIPDHPPRTDSPEYVESRRVMNQIARESAGFYYGQPPYQDHHGGGLWLKDATGWFLARNLAGIEWASQFCADPARVDLLRQNAARLYAAFPDAVSALGIADLLATPITDAAGVATWTDSICNASVALTPGMHTGVLPKAGGVHHYPAPIVEIETFCRDDFQLFVTDDQGRPVAVVPVAPRGSGDRRVLVLWAEPGTQIHAQHKEAMKLGGALVLPAEHSLAQQAFARQT